MERVGTTHDLLVWTEVSKLTSSDSAQDDLFAGQVAIDGDTAVVGSMWEDVGGQDSGAAYVFYRDQGGSGAWGQVAKLTADHPEGNRPARCT